MTRKLTEPALNLIAHRFKAMADPLRLKLILALMDGERNVGELVEASGATQANVSRHLQMLADVGVVVREKRGLNVFYEISDPNVFDLCELVCGSVEKHLKDQVKAFA